MAELKTVAHREGSGCAPKPRAKSRTKSSPETPLVSRVNFIISTAWDAEVAEDPARVRERDWSSLGAAVGGNHRQRVGIKSQHDTGGAGRAGVQPSLPDDVLMSKVHAVEHAHGEYTPRADSKATVRTAESCAKGRCPAAGGRWGLAAGLFVGLQT